MSNLARDGMTSADLLGDLRRNPNTRTAVKNADIVLFGVGGADLNAGDDDFAAGSCGAEACYAPVVTSFARNFDAIVGTVRALRGRSKHDGRCIDVLHAFNGVTGRANADKRGVLNHEHCCYPSAKGQQVMAELLFRTGPAPVR